MGKTKKEEYKRKPLKTTLGKDAVYKALVALSKNKRLSMEAGALHRTLSYIPPDELARRFNI